MKKWIISILATLFIFAQIHYPSYASEEKFDVLALGDSLATGVLADKTLGRGYADYVALLLEENDRLSSFNKGFSYPGYKTTDLLNDLEQNVEKSSIDYNFLEGKKSTITEAVEAAEVITLSIGANDVLAQLQRNADGTFTYNPFDVLQTITQTATNIDKIFKEIDKINPNAQVIVMGYYNPYPALKKLESDLNMLVTTLDNAVKKVVESNGATFIDVKNEIATAADKYVPNPEDVHLSKEGYMFVGQKMFEAINLYSVDPIVIPSDISGHWGEADIIQAIEKGIFKGYGDGTFRPNQTISRIEVTSIIARTFDLKLSTKSLPFVDLGNAYSPMVEELKAVYSAGIVLGDGSGNFKPNDTITREQIALMLMRAYETVSGIPFVPSELTPYEDATSLSEESRRAISFLFEKDVVDSAKNYDPQRGLTRAEAAKIFNQIK